MSLRANMRCFIESRHVTNATNLRNKIISKKRLPINLHIIGLHPAAKHKIRCCISPITLSHNAPNPLLPTPHFCNNQSALKSFFTIYIR